MRSTYTYVTLEVPKPFYDFVTAKLKGAGYDHAINAECEIDMHGLALIAQTVDPLEYCIVCNKGTKRHPNACKKRIYCGDACRKLYDRHGLEEARSRATFLRSNNEPRH